jgi:hypothetical protein
MKYVEAFLNAVVELFKWLNKKDTKEDADTTQVNSNPRPPKPGIPAPKPTETKLDNK